MLNFLTANSSSDGLRDHKAEKSHVLNPYGIVAQLRYENVMFKCTSFSLSSTYRTIDSGKNQAHCFTAACRQKLSEEP